MPDQTAHRRGKAAGLPQRQNAGTLEVRRILPALSSTELSMPDSLAHLVMLEAGQGDVATQKHHLTLAAPRSLWLPPGEGGRLRLAAGTRGLYLRLPETELVCALPSGLMNVRVADLRGRSLILLLPEDERKALCGHLETIAKELFTPRIGSEVLMSGLVSVVLVHLWRQAQEDTGTVHPISRGLVERFVLLVARHRREHWTIARYAEALGSTRARLTAAVRLATGLSPLAYIHRELLNEACDLLRSSGLQSAEIAYRLGFQDAPYFTRFFTRNLGQSPGQYRRQAENSADDRRRPTSFAAWP